MSVRQALSQTLAATDRQIDALVYYYETCQVYARRCVRDLPVLPIIPAH